MSAAPKRMRISCAIILMVKNKMFALVFYSHSDYSDVWPPMFSQTDKYFPTHKKYLFSNTETAPLDKENWHLITYDDTERYQQRMTHCLEQVQEEILLFHHEDMFLYETPQYEILNEITETIQANEVDIVKLICAAYEDAALHEITSRSYIYANPPNLKFAIQPSLCKKSQLMRIYDMTGGDDIWQFEHNSSGVVEYLNIKTGMTYLKEDKKKGMFHWESNIYPYFATAVVKGKWNISEYGDDLLPILESNNVDPDVRGRC